MILEIFSLKESLLISVLEWGWVFNLTKLSSSEQLLNEIATSRGNMKAAKKTPTSNKTANIMQRIMNILNIHLRIESKNKCFLSIKDVFIY